ncbi:MAG: histidine ammonia-lyase [Bdellovibrionia bacterium]
MDSLRLGHQPLTLQDVVEVAYQNRRVELSQGARTRIKSAHQFLQNELKKGGTYYGINTGFGSLAQVKIPAEQLGALQLNLLRSHACGVGPELEEAPVRAMLLLRAANLAQGHSGVSVPLVEQILALLNAGVHPCIPEQGSVGASGDLAPLAHLALVLIGEGQARVKHQVVSGAEALKRAGLKPLVLGPKEGIALINGTQFMTALGVLNWHEAQRLAQVSHLAGAMSLEALRGTTQAFEPEIHAVRAHPGQIQVAETLRSWLLCDEGPSEISQSHSGCGKVQDPYSLRCMPQVHGASLDALSYVQQVLEREINSVTDNPLIFPEQGKILSGGNFHGQTLAIAMDLLAISVSELGSISEQRLAKLVNSTFSDLPAFLTLEGGTNSGFMIVHVASAALASENKTLCHPASVDSIPTSADKEDHVSMGAWAARKASRVIANVRKILTFELLGAAQGIDLLRPLKTSSRLECVHRRIRQKVPQLTQDRPFYPDYGPIEELIQSGELLQF